MAVYKEAVGYDSMCISILPLFHLFTSLHDYIFYDVMPSNDLTRNIEKGECPDDAPNPAEQEDDGREQL